jgi:hypothetical protein
MAFGHGSRQRRHDDRVAQRISRKLGLRLDGLERALRDRQVALRAVVRRLRYELLLKQQLVLGAGLLGQGELGSARFERADPVGELGFEVGRVEANDDLSRLDRFTLSNGDLPDLPRYLGPDRRLIERLQAARNRQPARELRGLDIRQVGDRELERDRSVGLLTALARPQADASTLLP